MMNTLLPESWKYVPYGPYDMAFPLPGQGARKKGLGGQAKSRYILR